MTNRQHFRAPVRITRFTLRTFLIFTVLTGTATGFIGSRIIYVAQVMKCVREIEQHGAHVLSDFHDRYGLFAPVHHNDNIKLLEWSLSNPEYINIMCCGQQATDAVADKISTLHSVKHVHAAHVTATGLISLSQLTNLESLQLHDSAVTDETLELFFRLPRLQQLTISNSKITDRGLCRLAQLPTLKELYLQNAEVTATALETIDKTRPDLKVHVAFPVFRQASRNE